MDHMPCENLQTCQGAAGRELRLVGWSVRPYLVSRISVARPLRYRISQWPVSRISYLEVGAPCLVRQQRCLRARHAHHLYVIHLRLVLRAPPLVARSSVPPSRLVARGPGLRGGPCGTAGALVARMHGAGGSYAWSGVLAVWQNLGRALVLQGHSSASGLLELIFRGGRQTAARHASAPRLSSYREYLPTAEFRESLAERRHARSKLKTKPTPRK